MRGPVGILLGRAAIVALSALVVPDCQNQPYCFNCVDQDVPRTDATGDRVRVDSGRGTDGGVSNDAADTSADVTTADGASDGMSPTCDPATTNFSSDPRNCGRCGNVCNRPHAFSSCVGGQCVVAPGGCDVGFYNLDGNPDNGCEYSCIPVPGATSDTTCNMRDDDCNGHVDDGIDRCADVLNCGACGRICVLAHATSRCVHTGTDACTTSNTGCQVSACSTGFYDADHNPANGCEYQCTPTGPEVCDGRDNDCDGQIDVGDPGGGTACGSTVGTCRQGARHCTMGVMVCQGAVEPAPELCDGLDNDCNGMIDDGMLTGDTRIGNVCGSGGGDCRPGIQRCMDGAIVCVGAREPLPEVCDGRDNDCNGMIDDGLATGGPCGSSTGVCRPGTVMCVGGVTRCEGGTGPSSEVCDGRDNDCNGTPDDGSLAADARVGAGCGSATGDCRPGTQQCTGGTVVCIGASGPAPEICDGRDNDCNGMIDDGIVTAGPCESSTGACRPGTLTCIGGGMRCQGGTGPAPETCDGIDNDCNGTVDDGFDLQRDVNHCGRCGNSCLSTVPHAAATCTSGVCNILACEPGFVDDPRTPEPDCSYACTFSSSTEICNGVDDNCNGQVDEGVTAPANFCRSAGPCAGATVTCSGSTGWTCQYSPAVDVDPSTGQPTGTELRCDGIDNNCNGAVDETFANLGTSCSSGGVGACDRAGRYVCSTSNPRTTVCDATGGSSATELCDGVDNDCDGSVDETALAPGSSPSFVVSQWVAISGSGANTHWMMQYEASRPGASATLVGSVTTRPCSIAGVLPWSNISAPAATAACSAISARLCDEATEWQPACQTNTGTTCTWSYASTCTTYQPDTCNGADHDIASAAGVQNGLLPTGSLGSCTALHNAMPSDPMPTRIFDLTGNVREFTAVRSGVNPMRGGSYNSPPYGMACTFNFSVADDNFRFPNTGFRCCYTGATPP